ncbi:MAG: DUF2085 domain-containing protein [Anaerolineae bacterium]|nr:DUF2085 domain-containing protein [Anaerolineae bacterium]
MAGPFSPTAKWLGVALALAGVLAFIILTPGGLLRKLDYVGAAVCHRRLSHSFEIADHQTPLCQRCTGTFPGALTGVLVHWVLWRRRRSIRFPRWTVFVPLFLFAALWALDGINSTTSDSQFYAIVAQFVAREVGVGILGYAPQPWLRLLSGALMGMSMSVVLIPAFNQSLWSDGEDTATLRSGHELVQLIAIELGMAAIILLLEAAQSLAALYIVSIFSALGTLTMFTLLGAMMSVLILRRDATVSGWHEAWVPIIWGFVFALAIVAGMDAARLWFTGTIDGVPGLE